MMKIKVTLIFLIIVNVLSAYGQNVNINPILEGPYGQGSSIAVSIKIDDTSGLLKTNNVFKLILSDASGNFNTPKEIGAYQSFYTTFINGIIPNNLPAGNYRVKVQYDNDTKNSAPSNSFKVIESTGVKADIDANANQVITNSPKTFGTCKPERTSIFRFNNSSTSGATTALTATNEIDLTVQQFNLNSLPISLNAEMAHYTLFVKAELNGVLGTKAFFLINNIIKPGFSAPANSTVCLPTELVYDIETKSVNGIQNNFPGYTYQVNWGDGEIENITPNKIIAAGAKINHTYSRSSCGKQIKINEVNYYNVFGIIYQVNSPYCGLISVPISTQAKVVTPPSNRFDLPAEVCINSNLIITNSSIAGENPSATSPECTNNNNLYYWFVDGVAVTPQGVPRNYNLNHVFTTTGYHKIRLESESFSSCQALSIEKTCYVQLAPTAAFDLSTNKTCLGNTIKTTNQSTIDKSDLAKNKFFWQVNGPVNASFINGTNSESENPEFSFSKPGIYTIKLSIISPCDVISEEKVMVINDKPSIIPNWQSNICGKGQLLTFDESVGNIMQTSFIGTADEKEDTYHWEISGGAYKFKNNTNAHTKAPAILFEDYGTYTIIITHQNNCGTNTITKTIVFNEAPTVFAGTDQTVCATGEVALTGTITGGTPTALNWIGGDGVFSPSRNVLNPIYKPSAAEILKGTVQLRLSVNTNNTAPCNVIDDLLIISIKPELKVNSSASQTICSGTKVNYRPTAAIPGTIFKWSTSGVSGVTGFSESGQGEIKDILINTKLNQAVKIIYTITPEKDDCKGEPFELTVTVVPTPKVTAEVIEETICSGKNAVIKLTANINDLRYTWTSSATGKITGNSQNNTPKSLNEIMDVLKNTGDSTGTVTYTITPENTTGCAGTPIIISVNVSASIGLSTFSPDRTTGCSPLKIAFKNLNKGSINTYYWDFGDGQTLVTHDNNTVNHTYYSAISKIITAKLVTQTDCGSFTSEYQIRISPSTVEPALVVNGNEYEGCAPHTVNFVNNSKGALLFNYDFGDGTIIETNQSPATVSHTFTKAGLYKVKLTASNGCSDTTTSQTIRVYQNAVAAFTSDASVSCDSTIVKFTNNSTDALAYLWDFGDGNISTAKNPIHKFTNEKSTYSIRLISYSSFGCADTLTKIDEVKVGSSPLIAFNVNPGLTIQYPNYRFSFSDETPGEIESYLWDFGDGTIATTKDPAHNYTDTGSYKVTLIITNKTGCAGMLTKTVKILGTPGNLFIPNALMPNSLTEEIRSFQAKGSGMSEWHLRIFNKWGELVWETNKLDDKGRPIEGWDGQMFGQPAPQGIYFWEVAAKFINGTEWAGMSYNKGDNPKRAGTLNLIR